MGVGWVVMIQMRLGRDRTSNGGVVFGVNGFTPGRVS